MRKILLINPNASEATTAMMVGIASAGLPQDLRIVGLTAGRGPMMIVNEAELAASAPEVERAWVDARAGWAGVIISAFGDPGIERVRGASTVPVTGICEASMYEAAEGKRRFGVATVTPDLVVSIDARAEELGLTPYYTGIRLTKGDPRALANNPEALEDALEKAVSQCIEADGAEAVIIGGGPLGQAAIGLATKFRVPIIAPISAAVRRMLAELG